MQAEQHEACLPNMSQEGRWRAVKNFNEIHLNQDCFFSFACVRLELISPSPGALALCWISRGKYAWIHSQRQKYPFTLFQKQTSVFVGFVFVCAKTSAFPLHTLFYMSQQDTHINNCDNGSIPAGRSLCAWWLTAAASWDTQINLNHR